MRKHPKTGRRSGAVFAFGRTKAVEGGSVLPTVIIPIANYTKLDDFPPPKGGMWYGTAIPDLGFLQVEARVRRRNHSLMYFPDTGFANMAPQRLEEYFWERRDLEPLPDRCIRAVG